MGTQKYRGKYAAEGDCMARRRKAQMDDDDGGTLQLDKTGVLDELGQYLSIGKLKRAITLGTKVSDAMSPFLEKPNWWTGAKSLFSLCTALIEDVEVWADDYFSGDEWTEPFSSDFNQNLLKVLARFPYERIKTTEEHTYVRICTLPNGVRCGWTYVGSSRLVDHVYVETVRLEDARECIKQLLWEQFQGKSLLMSRNNRATLSTDSRVVFEVDNAFESKLSKRATDYAAYLKRPLAAGVSRSVMFFGPPGTGKSTLARTIVELMGMRSFRIRIGDLGQLDNSTLFEAVSIFEPDAVILDDFDRAHGQASLLETLQYFKQKVKLVVVTVNDRHKLDEALMRPERIDELYLIDKMDEEVVRHVLGEYSDGFGEVKDWPIAFIGEYVNRRRFMSPEEANESVKELALRVEEMTTRQSEEDVQRMLKLVEEHHERRAKVAKVGRLGPPVNDDDDSGFPDFSAHEKEAVPEEGDGPFEDLNEPA